MLKARDVIACNLPFPGALPAPGSALASLHRLRDQASHIVRALEEAGYTIAPKEPTQAMLDEVCCDSPYPTIVARDDVMRSVYKNMLGAFEPNED